MLCTLSAPSNSRFLFKQIRRFSSNKWHHRCQENQGADQLVATIRSLCSARLISAAVSAFSYLRRFLPNPFSRHLEHSISTLLAASASLRSLSHGSGLHALALTLGLQPMNPDTVSRLAAFYAACGLLHDARAIVEDSTADFAFMWNIVISAYLQNGFCQDAIFSYETMLNRGISPDNFTNSSVLKACGKLRELELGKKVHQSICSNCDIFVLNALLAMYAKCGALDIARKVFDEMSKRDIVSWNSMIQGYTSEGRWDETSELLERMRHDGFECNSITLNTIIGGHVYSGNHKEALLLISQARKRTDICAVNSVILILGLKASTEIQYLKQGKEIHGLTIRSACNEFENINNALITLYSKCHKSSYARLLFQRSLFRSVVTWNAMITTFQVSNNIHEAALLLEEMIDSRTEPNHTTIVTMLSICAGASELRRGKQLHGYATRHGFVHYLPIANTIVDMYCKSGRVLIAHRVFNTMAGHDKISYTALIAGYSSQRERVVALKLFNQMVNQGIEPDQITIGMVCSGWRRMRRHSSVRPSIHQYGRSVVKNI